MYVSGAPGWALASIGHSGATVTGSGSRNGDSLGISVLRFARADNMEPTRFSHVCHKLSLTVTGCGASCNSSRTSPTIVSMGTSDPTVAISSLTGSGCVTDATGIGVSSTMTGSASAMGTTSGSAFLRSRRLVCGSAVAGVASEAVFLRRAAAGLIGTINSSVTG